MLETPRPARLSWKNRISLIPFCASHLVCFAAIWTGVTWEAVIVAVALYWIRMFGVTGGYHRYFSHRTYKLNRFWQFCMAFLAQTSSQKGALWWCAHHRHHHQFSDTEDDLHCPKRDGFWWAHVGWVLAPRYEATRERLIPDLMKYPELRFLNRFWLIPPIMLAVGVWLWLGWAGLIVGFFWSTVVLWHGTFTINSLTHMIGKVRYRTGDDSRNHLGLAIITMGEGWHNNHHYYQSSANQGFFWWEIDLTYYVLVMLSWVGIVKDLKKPPKWVIEGKSNPAWDIEQQCEVRAEPEEAEVAA